MTIYVDGMRMPATVGSGPGAVTAMPDTRRVLTERCALPTDRNR